MASTDGKHYKFETKLGEQLRASFDAVAPPTVVLLIVLMGWQIIVTLADIPAVILPSPIRIGTITVQIFPVLAIDAAITASTALLGLFGGICLGSIIAFAMTYSRIATAVIHPYLIALRIAPLIAIAPLIFLWVGDGIGARALLVMSMTVFPVAIASYDGLQSVPQEYLALMDSVGTSPLSVFFRVRVPAAAPSVFAGIKLGSVLSVIGTVVAEFVTLNAGLGYRVFYTSTYLQTGRTFAALLVLSLVGVIFYFGPAVVEKRVSWEI